MKLITSPQKGNISWQWTETDRPTEVSKAGKIRYIDIEEREKKECSRQPLVMSREENEVTFRITGEK